jgi:hypothetical protein
MLWLSCKRCSGCLYGSGSRFLNSGAGIYFHPDPVERRQNELYVSAMDSAIDVQTFVTDRHRSLSWENLYSLCSRLSHQNLVQFPLFPHACHMPRQPHSPWLDPYNDIDGRVQIMKLFIVHLLSPVTSSVLGRNIFLRTLFSNNLILCPLLILGDQVWHPYKTSGRIMVLCILTFTFPDSKHDHKRLLTEFPEFSLL